MARGRFITVEGGEGSGKSTQAKLLYDRLEAAEVDVLLTREPGGAVQAETVRNLLVTGEPDRWSPLAETLLNYAARDDHLRSLIRPALDEGKWVVCDRFSDSTRAYQGGAGGVPPDFIEIVEQQVVGDDQPDLTLIFDIPAVLGLERAQSRGGPEDRYENKGLEFHEHLREAFLDIARNAPERCLVIDASYPVDDIAEIVWETVAGRFGVCS